MTKIIFLDIDGVLVPDDWFNTEGFSLKSRSRVQYKWSQECCTALNQLLDKSEALVVLSSDWRLHYSLDDMKELFWLYSINANKLIGFTGNERRGMTSHLESNRSSEIHSWKDRHRIESWVAIDDLPLGLSNFIHIQDTSKGLTQELADEALTYLNK